MTKIPKKFIRRDYKRFFKLGKNRKNKQVWRRARGIHNKIRKNRFGYPSAPTIGYGTPRSEFGLVGGLKPVLVHNPSELSRVGKGSIVILARVGAKKKLELIKQAEEMKIKIFNLGGQK